MRILLRQSIAALGALVALETIAPQFDPPSGWRGRTYARVKKKNSKRAAQAAAKKARKQGKRSRR